MPGARLQAGLCSFAHRLRRTPSHIGNSRLIGPPVRVRCRDCDPQSGGSGGSRGTFDFILPTVAASRDLDAYTRRLKRSGTTILVGVPGKPHPTPDLSAPIFRRRSITGSRIGGIAETQRMVNGCDRGGSLLSLGSQSGRRRDRHGGSGLLGMALPPDFLTGGLAYLYHSCRTGSAMETRPSRCASTADPGGQDPAHDAGWPGAAGRRIGS